MSRTSLPLTIWLLVAAHGALLGQAPTYPEDSFADLAPTTERERLPAAPQLTFRLEGEIPLPGPLPGHSPRLRDGELVSIAVAGGSVVADVATRAAPVRVEEPAGRLPPETGSAWVPDSEGRWRYRAGPSGSLEAERRCRRCKAGFKRGFKLRVPGRTVAPPLVVGRRVYFGTLDNRLYCIKARSGHRVWLADVGGRVSAPLASWSGRLEGSAPRELSAIVVVPDSGARLVAIESERGVEVASLRLGDGEGQLVGGALATAAGRIVVARQKYAETEASLLVYRLSEPQPRGSPAAPAGVSAGN